MGDTKLLKEIKEGHAVALEERYVKQLYEVDPREGLKEINWAIKDLRNKLHHAQDGEAKAKMYLRRFEKYYRQGKISDEFFLDSAALATAAAQEAKDCIIILRRHLRALQEAKQILKGRCKNA